ncbi:carboxymuconolactone decarboxylase family protein [Conexibacter arvalis]|uniref:AhpD family alkylhydroperoxidase n=1 Tax=Conexibacter arvalis TaxID=912552 RepID=A0A840IGN5_9ACTN|nr:carboxymuconolactone decarboxylase family protein [Conexibacter arvalis]MBB4663110.1 AhpD family alkylhydroperoxidase [Conexibacter arvalis]
MSQTETHTLEPRTPHPITLVPGAMEALHALHGSALKAGLSDSLVELVNLRASQINGCSVCVELHARALKRGGASDERIWAVAGWRDAPYFDAAERVALELAEELTRTADRGDAVPDALWEEALRHYDETALAALTIAIANVNVWNRLNVATRQVAGAWKG